MAVGKYLRGALIQFTDAFLLPLPNVIVFQFNPETMTHTWTPARPSQPPAGSGPQNPNAVSGTPQETFAFTLLLDASIMTTDGGPIEQGLASVSGLYSRLAALEMLLFPSAKAAGGLVGAISAGLGALTGGGSTPNQSVPDQTLPAALFVWGPGRVVPVRVSALTITEKLYDGSLLTPIRAEAQMSLEVLRDEDLNLLPQDRPSTLLLRAALGYSQTLREVLAVANLGNVASDIGILPV
jgi:hypothetical protein